MLPVKQLVCRLKPPAFTPAARREQKKHKDRVARLGCLCCRMPAQVHHITSGRGKGQKNNDAMVLPLCNRHHTDGARGVAIHAGIKTWEENFGTQWELLDRVFRQLNYDLEYIKLISGLEYQWLTNKGEI